MGEMLAGFSILIIAAVVFGIAGLLIFSPLMLYGIFRRQGQTNNLLRRLAERGDQTQIPPPAPLVPASPAPSPIPAPMFRTLG